jgi:hypothetical protein
MVGGSLAASHRVKGAAVTPWATTLVSTVTVITRKYRLDAGEQRLLLDDHEREEDHGGEPARAEPAMKAIVLVPSP